eukprot:7127275-Pyramimonas_sp.AAC.1
MISASSLARVAVTAAASAGAGGDTVLAFSRSLAVGDPCSSTGCTVSAAVATSEQWGVCATLTGSAIGPASAARFWRNAAARSWLMSAGIVAGSLTVAVSLSTSVAPSGISWPSAFSKLSRSCSCNWLKPKLSRCSTGTEASGA